MFTCTVCVSAGVVEVPVIVSVAGPFVVPGALPPPHPASTSKSTIALTTPNRMRVCCVLASKNMSSIASRTGTSCRIETGVVGILVGGTMSAVVASDTCAVCADVPFAAATDVGVTVQVERFGAPPQVNATAPVNPFMGVMVTLKLSVLPAVTLCVVVGPVSPKSGGGFVPVPVSPTVCVGGVALSVMVKVPARAPVAVGVNVTLILQFAPAASIGIAGLIGQAVAPVLVHAKSPDAAMEVIVRGPVPVFVSVTVCAALVVFSSWLAKVRLVGASTTAGAGFAPVPVSAMFCGLVLSPSVRTSVAVSAAATDGLHVTLTVQEAPAAMLAPQPLDAR